MASKVHIVAGRSTQKKLQTINTWRKEMGDRQNSEETLQ